jgi:hypothetical protein
VDWLAARRYRSGMMQTEPDVVEPPLRSGQIVKPLAEIHASRLTRHAGLSQFKIMFMLKFTGEPSMLDCARIDEAWRDAPAWCREQLGPPWSRVRHPDSPWLRTKGRLILYFSNEIAATAFKLRWA